MPLLIIEDNKDLVQVLSEGFAENGFSVDSAFSGEEGLEKISRGSYGCIILDIMLPGIDGLQVLDTVRAQGNETPVLLLTARDTVEDRVDGLNRGDDDYLSKPFDFGNSLRESTLFSGAPRTGTIPSSAAAAWNLIPCQGNAGSGENPFP